MTPTTAVESKWSGIVQRAQTLEPEAFDEIVEEFAPRIRGFVRRIAPACDVDDLVQEVFLRLVRSIKTYRDSGKFEAWVFQIARNLALDQLRRQDRTVSLQDSAMEQQALERPLSQPGERGYDFVTTEAIEVALQRLPDAEREVVLLRHFGRLTFEEIAGIMETPLGTALARAHRGLNSLRKMLEDQK